MTSPHRDDRDRQGPLGPLPPDLSRIKIDFSQFHPLKDHWAFSPTCRGYHGGGWNHLQMWWDLIASEWIHAHTLCLLGYHRSVIMTKYTEGQPSHQRAVCRDCMKSLGPQARITD